MCIQLRLLHFTQTRLWPNKSTAKNDKHR